MSEQKRVLIISYNALSKEGANGRTMEFLVHSYAKENLAQLFFSGEKPDFEVCSRFYRVTEGQLLKAFLTGKSVGGRVSEAPTKSEASAQGSSGGGFFNFAKKNKRSNLVKFLRNSLWGLTKKKWYTTALKAWISEFSPEVILTVSGKNSCFHNIVLDIAKEFCLPLAVYHCEDYCFKNSMPRSPLYRSYIRGLKKSVDKLMGYASLAIYNSDTIRKIYSEHYSTPSVVAYMSTDITSAPQKPMSASPVFSYMGNLTLGRDKSLFAIAKALYEIKPEAKVNLYGPKISDELSEMLRSLPNIEYKGFISYDECRKVISESDVLLHAESFDKKTAEDLRIAFSTKIADSLASGVPFFVYAPKGIAATDYLLNNDVACVATSEEELSEKLRSFLTDAALRESYIANALSLVRKNHTLEKTVRQLEERLNRISKDV